MIANDYFEVIFAQRQILKKKIPFFDDNHGLTPLENMQKCDYLKCTFLKARNDSFCRKDPHTLFQDDFCPNAENAKSAVF